MQRWNADSLGAFPSDAYDPITDALSVPGVLGNETTSYPGQKATYEFFFRYRPENGGQPKTMYGKIALLQDGIRILILSAHNPKSTTL